MLELKPGMVLPYRDDRWLVIEVVHATSQSIRRIDAWKNSTALRETNRFRWILEADIQDYTENDLVEETLTRAGCVSLTRGVYQDIYTQFNIRPIRKEVSNVPGTESAPS